MKKEKQKKTSINGIRLVALSILLGVLSVFALISSIVYYRKYVVESTNLLNDYQKESFEKHYVMITSDIDMSFRKNVYASASAYAKEQGTYLELLGENLDVEYDEMDLMKIAIQSQVDGIVLEAREDKEMAELIQKASDCGIPVVTVMGDCHASKRVSFVGMGNYDLGKKYGELVCEILKKDETKEAYQVVVLMDGRSYDSNDYLVYSSIQDTIDKKYEGKAKVTITEASIDNETTYEAEEVVRELFASEEEVPDVVICLGEIYTTCAYQAAIDYNKTEKVKILGYYQSDAILHGIESDVIYATVTMDTDKVGAYCVEALEEYNKTGQTKEYIPLETILINKQNVSKYKGR